MDIINNYEKALQLHSRNMPVVFKCILVGLLVSGIAILYRLALTKADEINNIFYAYIRQHNNLIIPMIVLLALMGLLIGMLIRKFPMTSGSGIPQVKGQILGYFNNPWISTLIVKFIGGTVSLLAGLSLGREGPTIQLGATAADGIGLRLSSTRTERKILIASGACAGLAAAFNAPLAGVMFALEEIFTYFSPTILLSTITVAITADFISKLVFGLEPVFHIVLIDTIPLNQYWLIILLGLIIGCFGVIYNSTLLKTIALYKKIFANKLHYRCVVPFVLAGLLGLTFPIVLGGGHHIIEAMSFGRPMQWLIIVLLVKFLFSMISFGSGAPGGIFFPLLVIGSLIGGIYGSAVIMAMGVDPDLFNNFVVLAMAGYFTAIVRAPITGVILLTEMTGSFSQLLPLTIVSIISYITADLLKSSPIYESLLENLLTENVDKHDAQDIYKKIMIEVAVHFGSEVENRCLREITLPEGSLVIAIRRHGKDITPRGDTKILAEDHLIVLTSLKEEPHVRQVLHNMTEV